MRFVLVLLIAAIPAPAQAENTPKQAAFKVITAYHCAPEIGDTAPYEAAKASEREVFLSAGMTAAEVDEMYSKIEADEPNAEGEMTEEFCRWIMKMPKEGGPH